MKFIGLLALAGAAYAHDFEVCSGETNKLGITDVTLNPDPVVPGENLSVTVSGKTTVDVTEGSAELDVKFMKIKIFHQTFDICKDLGVSCPIKAGQEWTGKITQPIPKELLKGKVEVDIKLADDKKADLGCVDLKVQIDKKNDLLFGADEAQNQFLFTKWSKQYKKDYDVDEVFDRYNIFSSNLVRIAEHDAEKEGFTQDMNEFGDLTFDEFTAQYLGYDPASSMDYLRSQNLHPVSNDVKLPEEVDWRKKNAVSEVKNQQQCGSCWAFSTVGAIEGINAITTGNLKQFSEQQLVDCGQETGNNGCNGGLMDRGFEYVIKHGLCGENDYPYQAKVDECKQDSCSKSVSITGYKDVEKGDEEALKSAVAQQPVSVAIQANQLAFQFYSGGVFSKHCGQQLDHGVLVVGYGVDEGKDYWIVKNSWGGSWGEQGYIRLERGIDQCGIANVASYPTMGEAAVSSE